MKKKRIYPENTPPGNIPYNVVNPAFRYRAIVPADDSIIMEVDANGVLYVAAANNTPTVATPVITVDGRTVTVTCATEGAEIYYTEDGSMPTINSTLYEGPISVRKTIHFRFVAVKNGMVNSQEATATADYFAAPVFKLNYATGELTILNPNTEGSIYYTTDGSNPTDQSTQYSDPFFLTVETTVKAIISDGIGKSSVISKTYTKCEAPTIKYLYPDLKTGFYSIVCSNENTYPAEIHYTTNGQVPSMVSPVYTEPIARNLFEGGITVKAVAFAEDHIPSDVSSLKCGESSVDAPFINVDGETVTIELGGNTADIPLQTTAANPTIGARIYYTTDGTNPTAQTGTLYTGPFTKTVGDNNVKAITVCYGQYASGVSIPPNYLKFTAVEENSAISFLRGSGSQAPALEFSTDGRNFQEWEHHTGAVDNEGKHIYDTLPLNNVGDSVYIRGVNTSISQGNYSNFVITGKVKASGSIMSILDGIGVATSFPVSATSILSKLFFKQDGLIEAPELPATQLSAYCYDQIFSGCSGLTKAPELPATQLTSFCYYAMFSRCIGLTEAPEIPATQLAQNCCEQMFYGCSELTKAPLVGGNINVQFCLSDMFNSCSKLSYVKVTATSWNDSFSDSWLYKVSPTGTFLKPTGTTIPTGASGIPSGWTVENI